MAGTILVVDDTRNNRELLGRWLGLYQYEIILAEHGQEGVERARAHRPDLILMDLNMPEMDGLEAARRIRADGDPAVAAIPIIAVTGYGAEAKQAQVFTAGCNACVGKPYKFTDLLELVERFAPVGVG